MGRKSRGKVRAGKDDRQYLLICEGKTEKNYFGFLNKHFKKRGCEIYLHDAGGKDAPDMIEYAKKALNRNMNYAKVPTGNVWLVFDYDARPETPYYLKQIEESGYNYIFCNYCLESWFVLHFAHNRPVHGSSDQVISDLNKQMQNAGLEARYAKPGSPEFFSEIWLRKDNAAENLQKARKRFENNPLISGSETWQWNPFALNPVELTGRLLDKDEYARWRG